MMPTEEEMSSQVDATLCLHVQRMNADRISATVDELKQRIKEKTNIPEERQRVIYRGRVLKAGDVLTIYEIEDESVLHLVERPEAALPNTNSSNNSNTVPPSMDPAGLHRGMGTSANVMLHAMQIDPSGGPNAMAQEITRSLMGAFQNLVSEGQGTGGFGNIWPIFGANAPAFSTTSTTTSTTSNSTTTPPTSTPAATTANNTTNADINTTRNTAFHRDSSLGDVNRSGPSIIIGQGTSSTRTPRLFSRPFARSTDIGCINGGHQIVRSNTRKVIRNLNEDLSTLTTFADDGDLFNVATSNLPAISTLDGQLSDMQAFANNLAHFERAYGMLANACREIRQGLGNSSQVPLDHIQNLSSMLQELPLLMATQRRLLGNLRVRPDGTAELWDRLDIPIFLDRSENNDSNNNNGNNTGNNGRDVDVFVEPPE